MTRRAARPPRDWRWGLPELMDRIADGVFLADATGRFIAASQAACESLGYTRKELLSLSVADITEDADSGLAEALEGVAQGEHVIVDTAHVRKDGTTFPVQLNISAIEFDGERCLLAIARDVTERKQAQEKFANTAIALADQTRILESALESTDVGIVVADENGKFIVFNRAAERITGIGATDTNPDQWPETYGAFRPDTVTPMPTEEQPLVRALRGESVEDAAVFMRNPSVPDGAFVSVTATPLLDDKGAVAGGVAVFHDVTERKRAEDELRKARDELETRVEERTVDLAAANEQLRDEIAEREQAEEALRLEGAMTKNMTEAVYLIRASDGVIVHTNPAFEKLFGYDPGELDGRRVSVLNAPTDKSPEETAKEIIAALDSTGVWSGEVHNIKKDGTPFWCYAKVSTFDHDEHGRVWVTYHTDITESKRAERSLRESEARYRSLYKDTPSAVYSIDREGRIIEASDGWLELLGYEKKEVMGRRSVELLTEDSRRYAETTALPEFWKTGRARNISYQFQRKNGEIIDVLVDAIAMRNEEGEIIRSLAALTDVTERYRAEKELRKSEERNRAILAAMPDMMFVLDSEGVYLDYHSSFTDDLYVSPDEFLGKTVREVMPAALAEQTMDTLGSVIEKQMASTFEYQLSVQGKTFDFEARYVPHGDDQALVLVRNITKRKEAEATIEHMAYHDSLTGLPNRALLEDHLELAIAQARRSGRKVAVMFLDVDRFKVINDTLGHPSGDKLLQRIADQLTRVVRDGDTVARVGGDEFILLLPDLADPDEVRTVAERALGRISRKRRLAGRELVVTASLGISVYPSDGDDAETLLSHADTAMYKAKEQGRNQFEFYDLAMGAKVLARFELEGDLRRALAQDELALHYQPQIAIDSGELVGVEALIRWQHPERGLLLPNEFIDVAQDSGLMSRLDEQTLRAASAQCVAWQRAHSPSLRLSVNFETNALLDRGFTGRLESILRSSGLAPANLVVEITEKHAVQDIPSTQAALRELKTMGVQIAVDDFGTGHSSLAYLSQFPVDVVKIDRAFVAGIGQTPEDSAIVVAIVSMARGLGLKVIAEGVETEEQLAFLKTLRCDEFQGYLFSKPVPPQEFEKLLSAVRS